MLFASWAKRFLSCVWAGIESNGFKKVLEDGNVPLEGITVLEDELTSACYLLQDNHNDHITIFYPGAMDGKFAGVMNDAPFRQAKLGVITVASEKTIKCSLTSAESSTCPLCLE